MQKYKVLSETGIAVQKLDGDKSLGDVIPMGEIVELDPENEQTKHFLEGGFVEPVVETPPVTAPAVASESVEPTEPTEQVEPRKRYRGQVVIEESERTVGAQTFKHIRLEDGSELDFTTVEYDGEVHVSYPPQK